MVPRIEHLVRTALSTFSRRIHSSELLEDQLKKLTSLASEMQASDLGYDSGTCLSRLASHPANEAPVTYIDVFQNDIISVGIFVLKPGAQLPLHDHHNMYGVIKVLHGSLSVQSFTRHHSLELASSSYPAIPVECHGIDERSVEDPACLLSPVERNLHLIKSVSGSASFLDILAPPYPSSDACHYYKPVTFPEGDIDPNLQFLMEIPCPDDYWCNSAPYEGPSLESWK